MHKYGDGGCPCASSMPSLAAQQRRTVKAKLVVCQRCLNALGYGYRKMTVILKQHSVMAILDMPLRRNLTFQYHTACDVKCPAFFNSGVPGSMVNIVKRRQNSFVLHSARVSVQQPVCTILMVCIDGSNRDVHN